MMRHLLSPSKFFGIGISRHVAFPFRVLQRTLVYQANRESFSPGTYGYLKSFPYEIFDRSEDCALPPNVYHGTFCDMSATLHFISSARRLEVQKWLFLQNSCRLGFVLSVKAVYTCLNGCIIVFTEPVSSTLSSWVTKMRSDQIPLVDPAIGYIIPKLLSIYRDILTSIMHVRNYTDKMWHGNVTLDDIWLVNERALLGCPASADINLMAPPVNDTEMFEDLMDIIHHDVLPRDLEFFCRVLHNDVRLKFSKAEPKKERTEGQNDSQDESVYLKDILREYKGKPYVPEQIFGTELLEEGEFERSLEELPTMSFEDFHKAMKSDKVKLLTSKEVTGTSYGFADFIVDLKDIPGEKSLHRTKWAMRLDEGEAQARLEEYTGRDIIEMLKPITIVLLTMVLLVHFTLSRRPKNFRKWDLWQGIDFSRSKAEARVDGSTGVKFSDVARIDEAVEELQELVRYLKNPELFDKMGIKPPHEVLLEGPPGCGKTLVAKAIAGEAGVPFYQMAGSEFLEVLVGVGSARIRDLFKRAKVNKPSVIFIDEIDALATRRQGIFKESSDHLYNAATQETETTLNQLLIELDGFDTGKGVIFLAATNRRDLLDPALLRPGRFDRKIKIRPPAAKGSGYFENPCKQIENVRVC